MGLTRYMMIVVCCLRSPCLVLATDHQCTGIAMEGSEYTLTCRISDMNHDVLWQLRLGGGFKDIATCKPTQGCNNSMAESFRASKGGDSHTSYLTILSANRSQETFRCLKGDRGQPVACTLQVYVKAEAPTCNQPSLVQHGTASYLQMNCSSPNVYPKGNCSFTFKGLPKNISFEVTTSHSLSTNSPGNYKINCSWLAPLSGLSPGLVQLQAEIYPELGMWVEEASTYSEWTQPVILSFPTVKLSSNCPLGPSVRNGYILAGATATCSCSLAHAGYPPGNAQWYTQSGQKVGVKEADGSALLSLTGLAGGSPFTCRPESVLQIPTSQVQEVTFSPLYATGPTPPTIDISDSFPLCPSETLTFKITCKVPSDKVTPQPQFTIVINNRTVTESLKGQLDAASKFYFLDHTFRPEHGGTLRIYCSAANEIFPEQSRYLERPLIVDEPPSLPPTLKTHNGQPQEGSSVAYVTDRSNIHLTCVVEGGHPRVTNTTIVCGNNMNTAQGPVATLSLRIPDGEKTLLCHCTAYHKTRCYDKRTEIILTLVDAETVPPQGSATHNAGLSTLGLGLGIGLGGAILALVAVIIIFVILHKRKYRNVKGAPEVQYSQPGFTPPASYQYAAFTPGRPAPPQSPALDDGDYDLIALETESLPDTSPRKPTHRTDESTTDPISENDIANGYIQPI